MRLILTSPACSTRKSITRPVDIWYRTCRLYHSDPRAILLKELARDLAREKGKEREFAFLELLEERAIDVFGRVKNNGKTVSSNVDFYSGFVYEMIGLPQEIFTPLFAMARIVGWCAHRNEELNFEGKRIIRPAYKNVLDEVAYVPIKKR